MLSTWDADDHLKKNILQMCSQVGVVLPVGRGKIQCPFFGVSKLMKTANAPKSACLCYNNWNTHFLKKQLDEFEQRLLSLLPFKKIQSMSFMAHLKDMHGDEHVDTLATGEEFLVCSIEHPEMESPEFTTKLMYHVNSQNYTHMLRSGTIYAIQRKQRQLPHSFTVLANRYVIRVGGELELDNQKIQLRAPL
jgi:hypothetical protein